MLDTGVYTDDLEVQVSECSVLLELISEHRDEESIKELIVRAAKMLAIVGEDA